MSRLVILKLRLANKWYSPGPLKRANDSLVHSVGDDPITGESFRTRIDVDGEARFTCDPKIVEDFDFMRIVKKYKIRIMDPYNLSYCPIVFKGDVNPPCSGDNCLCVAVVPFVSQQTFAAYTKEKQRQRFGRLMRSDLICDFKHGQYTCAQRVSIHDPDQSRCLNHICRKKIQRAKEDCLSHRRLKIKMDFEHSGLVLEAQALPVDITDYRLSPVGETDGSKEIANRVRELLMKINQDLITLADSSNQLQIAMDDYELHESLRVLDGVFWNEVEIDLVPQAEATSVTGQEMGNPISTATQNVEFLDENPGDLVGFAASRDPVALNDQSTGMDLGTFLKRPVLIKTITYADSDSPPAQTTFQPWFLFMNNTAIQRKLNNFAYIRGDLHIKAVVNATPFTMGAYLLDYQPLTDLTPSTISGASFATFIQRTQRPHMILYMSESEGGEMVCPFVYTQDWLRLKDSNEIKQMGLVTGSEMVLMTSANGQSGISATISIFAWMENVELSGTTMELAAQAEAIEYNPSRPLSSTASAVAAAASHLKRIPIIGRFATATEMGARLLAQGFAAFGFTNVPIISSIVPYRPSAAPPMATAEIGFPYERLTVDPKNELSIDPSTVGCRSEDPLAIGNIVGREAYLTIVQWTDAMAADTMIFQSAVTPALWDYAAITGGTQIYPTPMAWVSDLFQWWRGDIIFRFRAVATPFHKGRLRITFDPQGDLSSVADNTTVSYTEFMDLGSSRECTMRVPFRQARHWLSCSTMTNTKYWQTSGFSALHTEGITNGSISVRVLTKLQAPVTPATLGIQVFVKAAGNFQFAGPNEEYTPSVLLSTFAPQATAVVLGNRVSSPAREEYLEYMGEAITSLRQLLRRMTRSFIENAVQTTSSGLLAVAFHTQSRFPTMFGYDPNGFDQAVSITGGAPAAFNFVPRHPMAWVMAGFVGVRGSTHWNYIVDGTAPCARVAAYRDIAAPNAASWSGTTFLAPTTRQGYARLLLQNDFAGSAGQATNSQPTQQSLSVSYPFYSQFKFQSASPLYNAGANTSTPVTANDNNRQRVSVVVTTPTAKQTWASSMMYSWAGIGTDFDLIWFLNAPTIYKYSSLPAAT